MNWKLLAAIASGLGANLQANLSIQISGNQATLKWPSEPGGYYIETALNIADPQWSALLQPISEAGGVNSMAISLSDSARYFRLTTGPNVIFVDVSNGSDRNNGQIAQPVATLDRALMLARQAKPSKEVHVANGIYDLNGGTLNLVSGVNLTGGFDAANNWTRTPQTATVLRGGPVAVMANTLDGAIVLDGLSIQSAQPTTPGESSYGIVSIDTSLTIKNSIIAAARGANGSVGNSPAAQPQAPSGAPGQNGNCDANTPGQGGLGAVSPCGRNGGNGGRGGAPEATGLQGLAGAGGTPGGTGGSAGNPGNDGQHGQSGATGALGQNGAGGGTSFAYADNKFQVNSGNPGTVGGDGNGGGGGGGGGGQECFACDNGGANGGGGGGAGGCGGAFGGGGQGGGGSFGIFNTVGGNIIVQNTTITTQSGGSGGNGGDGGAGGQGGGFGQGGIACLAEIGQGGNGGRGGNGGNGGAGGGGSGGPSIGIFVTGPLTQSNNQITVAPGGAPGTGGLQPGGARASSGATGASQAVRTL